MNWRQLLSRLPINIVKNLNQEATREAQKSYETFIFRCWNCEITKNIEADGAYEAFQEIVKLGWAPEDISTIPHFIQYIYYCEKCYIAKVLG